MKNENFFICNPDKYLKPDYRISPFNNKNINLGKIPSCNYKIWESYAEDRWGKNQYKFTINGRHALKLAIELCNISRNNIITILTSSGNSYVSSCVTNVVESFCDWNREVTIKTDLIIVIHEFGKTFENLKDLKKFDVPIIEDCAYSFYNSNRNIGKVGDYCIYSFPKFFPIQVGGLLTSYHNLDMVNDTSESFKFLVYNFLGFQIKKMDKIIVKRLRNYIFLKNNFIKIGLFPRFEFELNEYPGVFMFIIDQNISFQNFKTYCNDNGIESSVFYGENAFFIPCHQNLTKIDLEYFIYVITNFFKYA
jgi:hypothetical protein